MQQIKVYISAKLEHAKLLAALNVDGFHINARWIEMADAAYLREGRLTARIAELENRLTRARSYVASWWGAGDIAELALIDAARIVLGNGLQEVLALAEPLRLPSLFFR